MERRLARPAGSPTTASIANVNNEASSITDQNITIEGCNFTADPYLYNGAGAGGFHHIEIRMARNVRVVGNRFTGGGDGTAMLARTATFAHIDGNYMTAARNACYDHWEAPQNGTVTASNYCESYINCMMATGTSTLYGPGIARNMRLAGSCRMLGDAGGAAVWFNGLAKTPNTSGVVDSIIDGPIVSYDSTAVTNTCVKVSGGQTSRIQVIAPFCRHGNITIGGDEDGYAKNVLVTAPVIDEPSAGFPILVQGGGTDNVTIQNARVRKGRRLTRTPS